MCRASPQQTRRGVGGYEGKRNKKHAAMEACTFGPPSQAEAFHSLQNFTIDHSTGRELTTDVIEIR